MTKMISVTRYPFTRLGTGTVRVQTVADFFNNLIPYVVYLCWQWTFLWSILEVAYLQRYYTNRRIYITLHWYTLSSDLCAVLLVCRFPDYTVQWVNLPMLWKAFNWTIFRSCVKCWFIRHLCLSNFLMSVLQRQYFPNPNEWFPLFSVVKCTVFLLFSSGHVMSLFMLSIHCGLVFLCFSFIGLVFLSFSFIGLVFLRFSLLGVTH